MVEPQGRLDQLKFNDRKRSGVEADEVDAGVNRTLGRSGERGFGDLQRSVRNRAFRLGPAEVAGRDSRRRVRA